MCGKTVARHFYLVQRQMGGRQLCKIESMAAPRIYQTKPPRFPEPVGEIPRTCSVQHAHAQTFRQCSRSTHTLFYSETIGTCVLRTHFLGKHTLYQNIFSQDTHKLSKRIFSGHTQNALHQNTNTLRIHSYWIHTPSKYTSTGYTNSQNTSTGYVHL
jgi:hypothetical protein